VHDRLLAWFDEHGRDLPWRHTRDPYPILVSEVMLQQTQVSRVLPRWRQWMERWATVEVLAAAPVGEVIAAWSGLGYDRRAVNLHRCARAVVERGGFPREPAELERLPGIGPYTARAVACFAFGAQVAAPDTNVRRVCERAFGDPDREPPPGRAYEWNQALFDLGREVCIARCPRCGACPLADGCPSRGRTFAPARRQAPFEGSFRQRRSTLLGAVRAHALPVAEADAEALAALLRDGLLEVRGGLVSLPA
jgi:A/G-specific adenine glycosylase